MIFTIFKGWHYSLHFPKLHWGKTSMRVKFRFLDGCWFRLEQPDDFAINKLCGWGFMDHHKDSIRCGWRPSAPGIIDLYFYLYQNGIRYEKMFSSVEIGREYELEMSVDMGMLSFTLKSEGITTSSTPFILPKTRLGYYLFPYIGGKKPARMKTKIELTFL